MPTIRLSPDLDEALERVVPAEFRGGRKSELRAAYAIRRFIAAAVQDDVSTRPDTYTITENNPEASSDT